MGSILEVLGGIASLLDLVRWWTGLFGECCGGIVGTGGIP